MGLTVEEGRDAIDVMQATWAPDDLAFVAKLPAAEAMVIVELAARFAARPVHEAMIEP